MRHALGPALVRPMPADAPLGQRQPQGEAYDFPANSLGLAGHHRHHLPGPSDRSAGHTVSSSPDAIGQPSVLVPPLVGLPTVHRRQPPLDPGLAPRDPPGLAPRPAGTVGQGVPRVGPPAPEIHLSLQAAIPTAEVGQAGPKRLQDSVPATLRSPRRADWKCGRPRCPTTQSLTPSQARLAMPRAVQTCRCQPMSPWQSSPTRGKKSQRRKRWSARTWGNRPLRRSIPGLAGLVLASGLPCASGAAQGLFEHGVVEVPGRRAAVVQDGPHLVVDAQAQGVGEAGGRPAPTPHPGHWLAPPR
jgi:hypothetical protein